MKLFRHEGFLRIARPVLTTLAVVGGLWHATHAMTAWRLMQQWKASDPSRSEFHWTEFQMEIGVTLAALMAAFFAWQVFNPRILKKPE